VTLKVQILPILAILALTACTSGDSDEDAKDAAATYLSGHRQYLDAMTGVCEAGDSHFGNDIGRTLNRADCNFLERTIQNALEHNQIGQAAFWENKESRNAGSVTPIRTYQQASGQYCRRYEVVLRVADETQRAVAQACRESSRSWRIVKEPA
jgi:surface antigen